MSYVVPKEQTAILAIDMQNAFCHPNGTLGQSGADISACQRAVHETIPLIETCRLHGIPDIWTMQEHFPHDVGREAHRIAAHTKRRKGVASIGGSWDAEIVAELKPLLRPETEIVRKHRFGSFYSTRMDTLLRAHGVTTLIITGTTTNACIDTTIREAYMRDFDLLIVQDCIGGLDPELHEAACRVWSFYMGLVVDAENLIRHLDSSGEEELVSSRILVRSSAFGRRGG